MPDELFRLGTAVETRPTVSRQSEFQEWSGLKAAGTGNVSYSPKPGTIMLHHLSIAVTDLRRAATFYDAVLRPLGYVRVFTGDESIGYGYAGQSDKVLLNLESQISVPGEGFHLAFSASEPEHVDRFHAAALLHGGRCNGQPGPRPDYGNSYYAAFVFDPDGYRIEAVMNQAS